MENLRRCQSSRKAYRAHLTNLHRTVAKIMDSSESPEDSALDSLSTSIEKLQQKAKAIGELDSKNCWRDGITDSIDRMKQFISHHTKRVEPRPRVEPLLRVQVQLHNPLCHSTWKLIHLILSSSRNSGSIATSQSSQSVSRLPKLSLPTFNGDPLSWQTFWDSFVAAVDSSPVLSGVQKFTYLRAQLLEEAARAVARLQM